MTVFCDEAQGGKKDVKTNFDEAQNEEKGAG